MAKTSPELINIDVRNQVLLERLKAGEHEKFARFLKRLDKQIRARLIQEGGTTFTKKRLSALLVDMRNLQRVIYDDYAGQFNLDLIDIANSQAMFEARSYERVTLNYESNLPSAEQISTAVRVNPLQVEGYTGNPLLQPFTRDWSTTQIQRVNNVVQQGFYQGLTTNEIARNIRGTKANRFNDGTLAQVNRANQSLVRTAVQHASTQARHETMRQNSDLIRGYQWVSTLDSRTTLQCSALDGRRFKEGEGPLPPIHINCRSSTTPVLDERFDFLKEGATRASKGAEGGEPVSAKETYYSWLKKQPEAFQNDAIGVTRGELLRNGGLTADEFARLSLNRNFEPLTLKEMQRKMPSVFEKANISI